jgi:hypothetical protein
MVLKRSVALIGTAVMFALSAAGAAPQVGMPKVGANAIGGIVTGSKGPEAGVWVIAETSDPGNHMVKIVVTDEQGRFVLPDLPKANYKVWSRGYGLLDSAAVQATPGNAVGLMASPAPDAATAAQVYPADYWFSLIHVPPASDFPGTGPKGNGINPAFKTQQNWIAHMLENCQFCHQLGTKRTRELPPTGSDIDAWSQRTSAARSPDDVFFEGDKTYQGRYYGERMNNLMTLFGRERGLKMYADWTERVAKGETPAVPARPVGIERNIVITSWDMAGGRFMHDSSATDKRNPTINANGPIYGYATFSGMVVELDPNTGKQQYHQMHDRNGKYFKNGNTHTGTMDHKGRLWMSNIGHYTPQITRDFQGDNPAYCTDPNNKFAAYFPQPYKEARLASVFDPKTGKDQLLPMCFGTHHMNFDSHNRLYFSGDTQVVGWLDVDVWDKTQDLSKATGWCPLVLDTNGDGKITPDRNQWNLDLTGIAGGEGADYRDEKDSSGKQTRYVDKPTTLTTTQIDPTKDTRIAGYNYGMAVSPKDQSYWAARYSPYVPSGVFRVETGSNPPQTCKTEYYEAPKSYQNMAFNARGVDVDADGVAWVAFGTGAIGKFDRSKCKKLNGPAAATGQQCEEGWEIIQTPGPKFQGTQVGSDWFYLAYVDHHNALGLGQEVPLFPNSTGDELLAYLPKDKKFVHLRVPYPLSFYARGMDGRIDNEKAGWKGRGIWSTNNVIPLWHQENGEGTTEYAAHFQLRPDPLAQ